MVDVLAMIEQLIIVVVGGVITAACTALGTVLLTAYVISKKMEVHISYLKTIINEVKEQVALLDHRQQEQSNRVSKLESNVVGLRQRGHQSL